ncbi:MAG TPA: leucyl aminopeptidase family protein [Rhodanobacteraceae bacterium]|nr:leucyl aminopeptidase family protein [Rhodanobacteraceae bacterium]
MNAWIDATEADSATPLLLVDEDGFDATLDGFAQNVRGWCARNGFSGQAGQLLALPDVDGAIAAILVGCDRANPLYALGALPMRLPEGRYLLDPRGIGLDAAGAALRWALGAYQFSRYRQPRRNPARLAVDAETRKSVAAMAGAIYQVRDLVNTPTENLGPDDLAAEVRKLAETHAGSYRAWIGDDLLAGGFPAIHAVGRASHRAPCLATMSHGDSAAPHVVLIGKGVCFDSGGLDIKTADGMRWMKKDMGGAAHAIALAALVLEARLPVRLTLMIPAVENAIAGNAYRPGEVIATRAGITVEVDNTDAEGRLVLCDALALATEHKPDLILDFATLTGAARVALGPDLPALFANRDDDAEGLLAAARAVDDPLWRLPLWRPYLAMLESSVADLANSGSSRHAGAITAALFLERFVPASQAWAHLDVYAWNDSDKPGHPRGGEAQGLRACFEFLERRYSR